MRSIESLLGEIATEAAEAAPVTPRGDLPPLRYDLEFVRGEDGRVRVFEGEPDDSWNAETYFDCYLCQCPTFGVRFCETCQIDYCSHPHCLERHARMHAKESDRG